MLFLGDVVGRSGRDAVCGRLPELKKHYKADIAIVNGENAAGGFGISPDIYRSFVQAGADIVTTGNHVWDQKEIMPLLNSERALVRAVNFPEGTPGRGVAEHQLPDGRTVAVIHLMGQVFMPEHLDCPFRAVDKALEAYRLGKNVSAIVVDLHAEAASEKMAMGQYLDGRVSLVVGTHTHVPTADVRVLSGGTAYQTDAGMCGDYNSVIGFEKDAPLQRFLHKRKARMKPAAGEATLCGLFVETDDQTGLAVKVEPLKVGGVLGT